MLAHKKKYVAIVVLVIGAGLVTWLVVRGSVHPQFGRIYTAEMVESRSHNWQTRWERGEATVRRWLHVRQRQPPPDGGLQIGSSSLQWSLGGHIYMSNPADMKYPLWEFALSTRTNLAGVTRQDLNCEFYGMNDARGTNVFGAPYAGLATRPAFEGRALRVPDGQVFFARLATNRSTVYVIQLGKWQAYEHPGGNNGRIRIRYVVVTNQPPR